MHPGRARVSPPGLASRRASAFRPLCHSPCSWPSAFWALVSRTIFAEGFLLRCLSCCKLEEHCPASCCLLSRKNRAIRRPPMNLVWTLKLKWEWKNTVIDAYWDIYNLIWPTYLPPYRTLFRSESDPRDFIRKELIGPKLVDPYQYPLIPALRFYQWQSRRRNWILCDGHSSLLAYCYPRLSYRWAWRCSQRGTQPTTGWLGLLPPRMEAVFLFSSLYFEYVRAYPCLQTSVFISSSDFYLNLIFLF